jgi:phosphoglycolate phosphatase
MAKVENDQDLFQLIIFDFDGTLADSFAWFVQTLNQLAPRWGFRPIQNHQLAEALRHLSAAEILRSLGVAGWKIPWIARDLRARMRRDIQLIRPFDGVLPMLRRLAQSECQLGIASSNVFENVRHVLGSECIRDFAALECGIALGGKHRRLSRLCRRLGVAPDRALYIGDELRDIEAARRAGVAAAAVAWGYNHEAALIAQQPDLFFRTVAEIAETLALTERYSGQLTD